MPRTDIPFKADDRVQVNLNDDKYQYVIRHNYKAEIFRYREPWEAYANGTATLGNLEAAMGWRIQELEEQNAELQREIKSLKASTGRTTGAQS